MAKQPQNYGDEQVQVLEGLEAVRKRPGMYIGSTSGNGLHHLVKEIVDNSIDEHLAGHCSTISVIIHKDNSITVKDNGRGIPVGNNEKLGIPTVEVVLTVLHAGGKFGGAESGYIKSGGLHGVGASCVNALSEYMTATVKRDGKVHRIELSKGDTVKELQVIGECPEEETGTEMWFKPDPTIFKETTVYDFEVISSQLKESAYLNRGLSLSITDERSYDEENETFLNETFCFEGGVSQFVTDINEAKILKSKRDIELINEKVIYISDEQDGISVEVAFQYIDDFEKDGLRSYANNIRTTEGGTHVKGFRTAITNSIKNYITAKQMVKPKDMPKGDDNKQGLTAIVSVKHPDPEFEGQTKGKLGNAEVSNIVSTLVSDNLNRYFGENPNEANAIAEKVIRSYRERIAARTARNIERKKKSGDSTLPGKLKDCVGKDFSKREIFFVEGDSAGGSAIDGRERLYQAILALRGKVINTEKATLKNLYNNNEIDAIRRALGTGLGDDFDYSKLRYNRIIIMTDADVDGHHISILLLTLFYRFLRPLIENGHVYLANPPLYKIQSGKKVEYAYSDEELQEVLIRFGNNAEVQRYKGLGEMNNTQLWETTMDPETRTLYQVQLEDAERAEIVVTNFMGDKVEPRKQFLAENSYKADIDA